MSKQIEEFKQFGIMADLSSDSTYRTLGEYGYGRAFMLQVGLSLMFPV